MNKDWLYPVAGVSLTLVLVAGAVHGFQNPDNFMICEIQDSNSMIPECDLQDRVSSAIFSSMGVLIVFVALGTLLAPAYLGVQKYRNRKSERVEENG